MKMSICRRQYDSLLTDDKRRRERNVRLLAKLENIEKKAAFLQAKTDRIKSLKCIYKNQFQNPKKTTVYEKKNVSPMKRDIYPYTGGSRFNPYLQEDEFCEYQNLHYVVKNITLDEAINEISKRYVLIPKNSGKHSHPHNISNSEEENPVKNNQYKTNHKSLFVKPDENEISKSNSNYETYNDSDSEGEDISETSNAIFKEKKNKEKSNYTYFNPTEQKLSNNSEEKITENNDNVTNKTIIQISDEARKEHIQCEVEDSNSIVNLIAKGPQLTINQQYSEILSEAYANNTIDENDESLQNTQGYDKLDDNNENLKEHQNVPEYKSNQTRNQTQTIKSDKHDEKIVSENFIETNVDENILVQSNIAIEEQSEPIHGADYDSTNNNQDIYPLDGDNSQQYTGLDLNTQQYQEQVEPQDNQQYAQNEGNIENNQISYSENANAQYPDENGQVMYTDNTNVLYSNENEQIDYEKNTNDQYPSENDQINYTENTDAHYSNENGSYPQYDQLGNQNYEQTQYYENTASNDPQYQEYTEQTNAENMPAQNEDIANYNETETQENQGYVDPNYYSSEYDENYEAVLTNENMENYNDNQMHTEPYNVEYDQNQYEQNANNSENYSNNSTNLENEPQESIYGGEYDQSQYEQTTDQVENYNQGANSQYFNENYDQTTFSQDNVENAVVKPLEIFDTDTEQISNKEESYVQESDFEFSTNQ